MRPGAVVILLLLAACGQEITPEEQALQDERDIALVEKANSAADPLQEVTPEPIGFQEIEENDLFGAGCNYAPGTSFGTRVIVRQEDAWMKIEGELVRFAADSGAQQLPLGTRSTYTGKSHVLELKLAGEGRKSGDETVDYEGEVILRDQYGRVVYDGSGLAQCGS